MAAEKGAEGIRDGTMSEGGAFAAAVTACAAQTEFMQTDGAAGTMPAGAASGSACRADAPRAKERRLPRVNFRPLLFAALGCMLGAYLYLRIAFGGFAFTDVLFLAGFFVLVLSGPLRRALAGLLVFVFFMGAGALLAHFEAERFCSGMPAGAYAVTGTVQTASVRNGQTQAVLISLTLDGSPVAGKMTVTFPSEEVRPADMVAFSASVSRNPLPSGDGSAETDYANNVRYAAAPNSFAVTGRAADPFLRLNAALYDTLYADLETDEAGVAYALLTGNSRGMDQSFLAESRTGGIAHAFAVSGLHIGMLYAAAMLLFRPLGRYAFLPAVLLAACYSALCAFTVSSVRALLMCAFSGMNRMLGRKHDFLSSVSAAGLLTLLVAPAQLLTASFRLSYGAVLGLALFSAPFARGLKKLRLPAFLASYLSASAAVQLFTFPVMTETFGYVSVWGTLLNFFVIPALPVLFLPLVLCALLSAAFPAAAPVFLALPNGMLAALLYVFSAADFSAVLAGFSLGAGGAVWLAGTALLCSRVRLRALVRGIAAGVFCAAFALCLLLENVVFYGCKISVRRTDGGMCALVRTPQTAVLVVGGDISLSACTDLLNRSYGGEIDAVAVVGEDAVRALNTTVFLPAREVRVQGAVSAGLHETPVLGGEAFAYGALSFRYEGGALLLSAEGALISFGAGEGASGADICIGTGDGSLKYFVKDGIIKEL